MLKQILQIKTMDNYLNYFIDKATDSEFSTTLPKIKKRILEICSELEKQIDGINKHNFFQQWASINSLEAQLCILLEMSELVTKRGTNIYTEEEIIHTAKEDSKTYLKEKCGMTLADETPHSLHFSVS